MGVIDYIVDHFYIDDINDKEFLNDLKEVILREDNMPSMFLNSIKGSNDIEYQAHYSFNDFSIVFNFNIIKNVLINKYGKENIKEEHIRYMFYRIIMHEVGHAYEASFLNNNENLRFYRDSDNVLIGDIHLCNSFTVFSKLVSTYIYKKYHNYFPAERFAEVFSFSIINKVVDRLNLSDLYNYKKYSFNNIIEGYSFKDTSMCPLKKFYDVINRSDIYNSFDLKKFTSKEKFIYGLELSKSELISEVINILGMGSDEVLSSSFEPKKLQKYLI